MEVQTPGADTMILASQPSLLYSQTMTLTELLGRYVAANECSAKYLESLRRTVRKAAAYGIETVCQLNCSTANDFLASLRLAATTRSNIRRELCTLWRFAYDREWTQEYPARVRRIRPQYAPPVAWTLQQLDYMLTQAEKDRMFVSSRVNLRRCEVLPAWIGIGYDTGIRFTDIHLLHARHFRNGCIAIVCNKTRKPLVRKLSRGTLAAVARLLAKSPDGSLFRWAITRRRAFLMWRDFLDQHALGGSSKWLRRTVATQVHKKKRGAATEFLQHSQENLAMRHYIDQTQLDQPMIPPSFRRKPR